MSQVRDAILGAGYPEILLHLEEIMHQGLRDANIRGMVPRAFFDKEGVPHVRVDL